jgi:hypothetical protein
VNGRGTECVYFQGDLPSFRTCQPTPDIPQTKVAVAKKLSKFLKRGYIEPGTVQSLISYFSVPKGDSDIRLVFDGTKSGYNARIWAPSFCLPSVDSLFPMLEPGTWQSDIDIGEQFYNFLLDPALRPFCGIDVDLYLREEGCAKQLPWMQWDRCVMGLSSSPHGCLKMQMFAEELVRGDHTCGNNLFFFDAVRLNLPSYSHYDPALPRVSKIDSRSGRIARDMSTYVDDVRNTGATALQCWRTSHWISEIFCYLGLQDALGKCTVPSMAAGAWTGALVQTGQDKVIVTCTAEKWTRAHSYVLCMQEVLASGGLFHHKMLEQQRGFLVYIARMFPSLVPYLKGIHLTLDSWWRVGILMAGKLYSRWKLTSMELPPC